MIHVQSLTCIYDTKASAWAIELALDGDVTSKRFTVGSANDAEMLIEAFEDSSASSYDPESGELRFDYAFLETDDEDDEEDEDAKTVSSDDEDEEEDEDEDEQDEDQPGSGKKSAA